jgi:glycogen operon protein
MTELDRSGQPIVDDTFLLLLNACFEEVEFRLPDQGRSWELLIDTSRPAEKKPLPLGNRKLFRMEARSFALFRAKKKREARGGKDVQG